jgi:acetylglutamate kinase
VTAPLVLKLGGELLETADDRRRMARVVSALAAERPVVIVHGGGRAVDAELARRQVAPRKVDGLRITDADTLDAVVAVLGGSANTAFVAALVAEDVPAVGLTGVDAGLGRASRASAYRTAAGTTVDLGLVGDVVTADVALLTLLVGRGYVPVVASLGLEEGPRVPGSQGARVLNINADVMACAVASALTACDLVIAGTTPGVLDANGRTIPALDALEVDALVSSGTATAGMIAKLSACRAALEAGVSSVRIVDGRHLESTRGLDEAPGTAIGLRTPVAAGRTAAPAMEQ